MGREGHHAKIFRQTFISHSNFAHLKPLSKNKSVLKNKGSESVYQFNLFDFITDYEKSSPEYDELKTGTRGKIFVLERDVNCSGNIDIDDLEWHYLDGDGDFRSEEVKKLRDEADIIITNPPFSLFREFVAWIMEANKKCLIVGNVNCVSYKEIFPLLKSNKLWTGCRFNERVNGKNMTFRVPDNYPLNGLESELGNDGKRYLAVPGIGWYTNLEHGRRHQPIPLMTMHDNLKFSKHKQVKDEGYKKFDNYDAINIPFTDAIPSDYDGLMGVPISFMKYYCPEQFEIIDGIGRYSVLNNEETKKAGKYLSMIDGKAMFFRIIIKRRKEGII